MCRYAGVDWFAIVSAAALQAGQLSGNVAENQPLTTPVQGALIAGWRRIDSEVLCAVMACVRALPRAPGPVRPLRYQPSELAATSYNSERASITRPASSSWAM